MVCLLKNETSLIHVIPNVISLLKGHDAIHSLHILENHLRLIKEVLRVKVNNLFIILVGKDHLSQVIKTALSCHFSIFDQV